MATGVELVGQSGEKLDRIVRGVAEINALIDKIASSASMQAEGLTEVTTAMDEMERMTQQNAAMVEQSSAATRSLSNQAQTLIGIVESFRTRDLGSRPDALADPARVRRSSARESDQGRARRSVAAPEAAIHRIAPSAPTIIAKRAATKARAPAPPASNMAAMPQAGGDWSEF
ncbi:hypothetical protein [Novosphingobium sp. Chol11]|uniref:hypothetical protein n=1 Tax=Novosphingobium sp. Chol11 TaxID=1385763 RepID=UPI0025F327C2|nr:hypothetical protein [Novosphingobium sp. Chol11]